MALAVEVVGELPQVPELRYSHPGASKRGPEALNGEAAGPRPAAAPKSKPSKMPRVKTPRRRMLWPTSPWSKWRAPAPIPRRQPQGNCACTRREQ